jgi:hypothetical protein
MKNVLLEDNSVQLTPNARHAEKYPVGVARFHWSVQSQDVIN